MGTLSLRITLNPEVCNGSPTIRNMRFTVANLLELLAAGMTNEEILADYPYLEKEDIEACLWFASQMANTRNIIPTHV
jgi:uncharacterized protein (DUF433 family)